MLIMMFFQVRTDIASKRSTDRVFAASVLYNSDADRTRTPKIQKKALRICAESELLSIKR